MSLPMVPASTIFRGSEIAHLFEQAGITHVIWIPDSTTGQWESALSTSAAFTLLKVCREGEAWPLAAGLMLGGQRPMVIMQSTGLFESGDALRNIVMDLRQPVCAIIGARNWLTEDSQDSAKRFLEPILQAWGIQYSVIHSRDEQHRITDICKYAQSEGRAAFAVLAEGKG